MRTNTTIFTLFTLLSLCAIGNCQETSVDLSYENHNQTDYGPLKVTKLRGIASDPQGVPIPLVLVLLFSNKDHRLLAQTKTDEHGVFGLGSVKPGRYRLVIKYEGFCSANVSVETVQRTKKKARLIVHMKPRGMDECSYGALK